MGTPNQCIFHAEQEIGDYFRETWGRGHAERSPEPARTARVDQSQLPLPWLCRGYSLEWPMMQEAQDAVVANS